MNSSVPYGSSVVIHSSAILPSRKWKTNVSFVSRVSFPTLVVGALKQHTMLVVGEIRVRLERELGHALGELLEHLAELILPLVIPGDRALPRHMDDDVVRVGVHERHKVAPRLGLVRVAQQLLIGMHHELPSFS